MSTGSRSRRRRLVRIGGGILVAWGCFTGWAISFVGPADVLAVRHPAIWATLEDIGSPLSTLISTAVGHPVMASVSAKNLVPTTPVRYTGLGAGPIVFSLGLGEQAHFTIVSPDHRRASIVGNISQLHQAEASFPVIGVRIEGPGDTGHDYALPVEGGVVLLPVELNRGVNHFALSPQLTAVPQIDPRLQVMLVENLTVAIEN